MLTYGPFNAVSSFVLAAKGGPPLKQGAHGPAVALLQGALIDLGEKLPRSTKKSGGPDGLFGFETFTSLKHFQTAQKLTPDGVAGKKTMAVLDKLMVAKMASSVPLVVSDPRIQPGPRDPNYEIGTPELSVPPDPAEPKWNSKPAEASYRALWGAIWEVLPHAYATIGDDATKHMVHYLSNSGQPYRIDLEGMVDEVPRARNRFRSEVAQAQAFAQTLDPGNYPIRSRGSQGSYNYKEENWNWFFAIGGYQSWGRGDLVVRQDAGSRRYDLDFEYKFYDRYNWDKGKSVTILGITVTDAFMAEFHRQGMAQHFDCVGSIRRKLSWRSGEAIPEVQLASAGGR